MVAKKAEKEEGGIDEKVKYADRFFPLPDTQSDPFYLLCLRVSGNAYPKPGTFGEGDHFGN